MPGKESRYPKLDEFEVILVCKCGMEHKPKGYIEGSPQRCANKKCNAAVGTEDPHRLAEYVESIGRLGRLLEGKPDEGPIIPREPVDTPFEVRLKLKEKPRRK